MAFNESFDFMYTGHLDGTISMFNISFEERKGKQIRQMVGKKKVSHLIRLSSLSVVNLHGTIRRQS